MRPKLSRLETMITAYLWDTMKKRAYILLLIQQHFILVNSEFRILQSGILDTNIPDGIYRVNPAATNNPGKTYGICEIRSTDDNKGWRFVTFYATAPSNLVWKNFYNSYGTDSPGWSGWYQIGLPIDFVDLSINLSPEQWSTSNNGLKYYNHTGWNVPSGALGLCANIMSWGGTSGNVTCSVYSNSYIQLRCKDAVSWNGVVRVFYINNRFL